MTLIVAKQVGNSIKMESDSRITDPNVVNGNPQKGLIKLVALNPFICVGYAGDVHFAEEAIRAIYAQKPSSVILLVALLLNYHNLSGRQTDFLIASVFNGKANLMKISSGKAEDKLSTGWIGDIEAFEFFQKEWNNRSAEKSEFESLTTAFKQTIENEKLESVGDFQISVITTDNNKGKVPTVMYEEKMELISGISQKLEIGKKSIPLTFGDASSGSYGISYFISLDLFNQAVGVHFPLGDFGLLFFPKVGLGAIKYSNTDAQGFIDSVKSDYGIPMKGFERMSDSAVRLISTLSR